MMDKIDRSNKNKYNMYMMGDSPLADLLDKVDELVEGYNEIVIKIAKINGKIDKIMLDYY